MHPDAANPLLPLVTLAAGVFLLIAPRIVSVAVAVYLIIAGLLGLNGIYHFFKKVRSAGPKSRASLSRSSALWACRGSRESQGGSSKRDRSHRLGLPRHPLLRRSG